MTYSKPRRVAIYARVSTASQTVENQFQELREVAQRNGWTVVAELSDSGISGAKGRDQRPAFDQLLILDFTAARTASKCKEGYFAFTASAKARVLPVYEPFCRLTSPRHCPKPVVVSFTDGRELIPIKFGGAHSGMCK